MPLPQRDRPLNDAECARLDAVLSRFRSEYAMNNLEEIDGFFAALICSPDVAKPSDYLPEIWGGEMSEYEAFADRQELQDFLSLLFRHWNSIVRVLQENDVFAPLLFQDEEGTAHANDWARGFMRGVRLHHESWRELLDDEEHGGPLIPIMVLAHEHDPDPEMRPYKDNINGELLEKIDPRHCWSCDCDLPLLCAAAPNDGSRTRRRANGIPPSGAKNRTQRSLPLRFGQEIQTLLWASRPVMNGVI
jgi:uncharacterized protein